MSTGQNPSFLPLPPALFDARSRRRAVLRRLWGRVRLRAQRTSAMVRRAFDVVASGIGLLVISPLLLGAAIAIRIDSRGPVFFAQERLGRRGRPFRLYKLRTMAIDAEGRKTALQAASAGALSGVRFKLRRDPRVTRVGAILRKFSIDELPQLWNVLRGDMTIIGPRPPVWREVALYDPAALRRLEVTPGLTCLWQVGGRSDLSFEEQVALDVEYIDHASLRSDVSILLRTIPAVVTGRGAY